MAEVKISVLLSGNLMQVDGLSRFTFIPSGRNYLIYSLNETTVQKGITLNKIYVSEEGTASDSLQPINDEEWENIKTIIGQLGKNSGILPSNIQMNNLTEMQYNVGPYRKLAIKDDVKEGIIGSQLALQPTNEPVAQTEEKVSTSQFFDSTVAEEEAPVENATQVLDAFSMSTPVPDQALQSDSIPVSPVPEAPADIIVAEAPTMETNATETQEQSFENLVSAPIVQSIEPAVNEETKEETQEEIVQTTVAAPVENTVAETPVIEQTVVEQPVVEVQAEQTVIEQPVQQEVVQPVVETTNNIDMVKQSLKVVMDYCQNDLNKLNELLNEYGFVAQARVEEVTQPVENVENSTDMNISNIPVLEQQAPAEENVLQEESFETPVVETTTESVEEAKEEAVVEQETETVTTEIVQPTETVIEQTVVPTEPVEQVLVQPTVETTIVPTETTTTELVQPEQTETQENTVDQPVVETTLVESNTVNYQQSQAESIQDTNVEYEIPDAVAPTTSVQTSDIPTIEPLTSSEVMSVQSNVNNQLNVTNEVQPDVLESPSSFLDAGEVVIPVGQSNVTSQGLPGASGNDGMSRVA